MSMSGERQFAAAAGMAYKLIRWSRRRALQDSTARCEGVSSPRPSPPREEREKSRNMALSPSGARRHLPNHCPDFSLAPMCVDRRNTAYGQTLATVSVPSLLLHSTVPLRQPALGSPTRCHGNHHRLKPGEGPDRAQAGPGRNEKVSRAQRCPAQNPPHATGQPGCLRKRRAGFDPRFDTSEGSRIFQQTETGGGIFLPSSLSPGLKASIRESSPESTCSRRILRAGEAKNPRRSLAFRAPRLTPTRFTSFYFRRDFSPGDRRLIEPISFAGTTREIQSDQKLCRARQPTLLGKPKRSLFCPL